MIYKTNEYLGYPDRISVPAGEQVKFQLSSKRPKVKVEVLRLRCGDVDANGPGFKYELMPSNIDGEHACLDQPIRPGSNAVIEHDGVLVPAAAHWSFGAYVYPTRIADNPRAVMGNWCQGSGRGYALELDKDGRPVLVLGRAEGGPVRFVLDVKLHERVWAFISCALDFGAASATVSLIVPADGVRPAAAYSQSFALPRSLDVDSRLPFLIAAHHLNGDRQYDAHFDGKIESPRVFSRQLDAEALRVVDCGRRTGATDAGLVAFWDFSDGIRRCPSRIFRPTVCTAHCTSCREGALPDSTGQAPYTTSGFRRANMPPSISTVTTSMIVSGGPPARLMCPMIGDRASMRCG